MTVLVNQKCSITKIIALSQENPRKVCTKLRPVAENFVVLSFFQCITKYYWHASCPSVVQRDEMDKKCGSKTYSGQILNDCEMMIDPFKDIRFFVCFKI